jgi:hypothetical protein
MKKQILLELILLVNPSGLIKFDTPVSIKNGQFLLMNIWQVMLSKADEKIFVMDSEQEWHQVEEHDAVVINPLLQRLRFLHQRQECRKEHVA